MRAKSLAKQSGTVFLLMTVSIFALLGMIGVALDLGQAYTMKTRLQNGLDAAALSAGTALLGGGEDAATEVGRDTFTQFISKDGNYELADIDPAAVEFTFSSSLLDWGAAGTSSFVRAALYDFTEPSYLIRVFGFETKTVAASATAGPIPIEACRVAPIFVCALNAADSACTGGVGDTCYGLTLGQRGPLTQPPGQAAAGPGNYGFIVPDGTPVSELKDIAAGTIDICKGNLQNLTGQHVGQIRDGIDSRIVDTAQGNFNPPPPDFDQTIYTDPSNNYGTYEANYQANGYATQIFSPRYKRREFVVPIVDCALVDFSGGSSTAEEFSAAILRKACFFLTERYHFNGPVGERGVYGEFYVSGGGIGRCLSTGQATGNPEDDPYKIILYKDPGTNDS
jgi:Putative Flp pilus-assembly TadE/G-like